MIDFNNLDWLTKAAQQNGLNYGGLNGGLLGNPYLGSGGTTPTATAGASPYATLGPATGTALYDAQQAAQQPVNQQQTNVPMMWKGSARSGGRSLVPVSSVYPQYMNGMFGGLLSQ